MARSIWLQKAKSYENLSSRVQKGKNTSLYPETNASHTNFRFKTDIYNCTLAVPALAYLYEPALEKVQRYRVRLFLVRGLSPYKAFCQGVYW